MEEASNAEYLLARKTSEIPSFYHVSLLRKACSAEFLPEAAGRERGQRTFGRSVRRMTVTATAAGEPEPRGFMVPACLKPG